jgi:hypothetical protein
MNARIKEAQNLEKNALGNKQSISNQATSIPEMVRCALRAWRADLLIFNVDSADLYTEVLNSHVY